MTSWLNVKLRTCPFCGNAPENKTSSLGGIVVEVIRCSTENCPASFKSFTVAQWNQRFDSNPTVAMVDELENTWENLEKAYESLLDSKVKNMAYATAKVDEARAQFAKLLIRAKEAKRT